jgi:hypothetical protein
MLLSFSLEIKHISSYFHTLAWQRSFGTFSLEQPIFVDTWPATGATKMRKENDFSI